jgi:hypothetical protein
MDAFVQLDGQVPRQVARSWLRAQRLLPEERAVR